MVDAKRVVYGLGRIEVLTASGWIGLELTADLGDAELAKEVEKIQKAIDCALLEHRAALKVRLGDATGQLRRASQAASKAVNEVRW